MQEQSEIDFKKGFNDGYLLKKHEPELTEKVISSLSQTDRDRGFRAGVEEVDKEKMKEKLPKWLQPGHWKDLNKGQDKEKDEERDRD